jgi:hypothetical protein
LVLVKLEESSEDSEELLEASSDYSVLGGFSSVGH